MKDMNVQDPPNYIMKKNLVELKQKLEYLQNVSLPEVINEKKNSYEEGGTHDNAGWEYAVNEERLIWAEIGRIQSRISNSVVIDDLVIDINQVGIGTLVEVLDIETREISCFVIVGKNESGMIDEKTEFISIISPLAQFMMGKRKNEEFELHLPSGMKVKYKILKIENFFKG